MEGESREFTVKYSYKKNESCGEITGTNTKVAVCDVTNVEAYKFAMEVEHENYLFCHAIDDQSMSAIHHFAGKSQSLATFIEDLKKKEITPVMTYVPREAVLPYESCKELDYDYVPSIFREIIRGLLSFVCYVHSKGYTLDVRELSMEDHLLVDQSSTLRYFNVPFAKLTDSNAAHDYFGIWGVVNSIFGEYDRKPHDMHKLTVRIGEYSERVPANEDAILYHMALLSYSKRITRIRGYKEVEGRLDDDSTRTRYKAMIRKLNHKVRWWTEKEMYGPMNVCLCFEIVKQKKLSHMDEVSNDDLYAHYDDRDRNPKRAYGCLKFCRNATAHLADHIVKSQDVEVATDLELECMIMNVCGEFLVALDEIIPYEILKIIAHHFA